MDFSGATNGFDAGFGKSDVAYFSFFDELSQTADRVFDRRVRINPVLVIKINVVGSQATQTAFAGPANVIRPAIHAASFGICGIAHDSEFRRNDQFLALALGSAADEFLILEWAINVGGIEESDSEFDSAMNGRNRFGIVTRAIEFRHTHAAESEGGNSEAGAAKRTGLHKRAPCRKSRKPEEF